MQVWGQTGSKLISHDFCALISLFDFDLQVWGKTGSKLYGPDSGADFEDNHKRFTMFCKAAVEAARVGVGMRALCVGLARTIYIRCSCGIFGREITKYTVTVIYSVYIRFWPTLMISLRVYDKSILCV